MAYFYSHPLSNQAIHDRVVRRLERMSGLKAAYDSASLTVATGQYRIRNLRFTDPKSPGVPVLTVGEVYASIRPWQLLSDPESVISRVVLKKPSSLELEYTEGSMELGPHTKFLVDTVRKAQPAGEETVGRLPFEELRIEDIDVIFTEKEGILPGITPAKPAMLLHGNMTIENAGSSDLAMKFIGQARHPVQNDETRTSVPMAEGVRANVLLKPTNAMDLDMKADHIALMGMFRELPRTELNADQIEMKLAIGPKRVDRNFTGALVMDGLQIDSPENDFNLSDRQVNISGNMDVNTSRSTTQIHSLSLKSEGINLDISGSAGYQVEPEYSVEIAAKNIGKDYKIIMKRFLPKDWDVQADQNGLAMDLKIQGNGTSVTKTTGQVALRGVNLVSPHLPAALKNVNGDFKLSPQEIVFKDVSAEYVGARMALDGAFEGNIWKRKGGKLAMNWSSVVPVEEILKLHGKQLGGSGNKVSGSGKIVGHGTWQQEFASSEDAIASLPHVEGEMEFQDVSLNAPALPAPVTALTGSAIVKGNKLVVDNLTGTMQGSSLEVMGEVTGRDNFWKDSQVSATLRTLIDFANLGPYLTASQKTNLERYELKGKATTELLLSGPLAELGSQFTGEVRVSDVSVAPGFDFLQGKFTDVNGLITWDGTTVRLDDMTGNLNGEKLALAGDISSSYLDIAVRANPQLKPLEKTFPKLGKVMDMTGDVSCDLAFTVGKPSDTKATQSIAQVLEQARILADTSVKENTYSLNGELKFKSASIRHLAMPPTRKENGREIPEGRVTKLSGKVNVSQQTFSVPDKEPLSCSFSDTQNCQLSGAITLRKNDWPEMKVKVSTASTLKLDTWALGWGKDLPKPDKPPVTGKHFDLDAEIIAPSVVFRGQEGGRSRAKLSFNMVQDQTPRVTTFREVVIQGSQPGMGRVIGSGKIESFVWRPQEFPKWQTTLDVQSMPLEAMLGAVFTDPANISGMITGSLNLNGVGDNARSVRGQGSWYMTNLEIGKTGVIRQLGQTTGRNFSSTKFETAQAATFDIGNGALSSRDLALQTNGLQLEMRGDYWFAGDPARGIPEKTINGALRLRLFKSVFGSIPIIGQVADLADEVANAFLLAFKVSGSGDNPQITPIALPLFQGGA